MHIDNLYPVSFKHSTKDFNALMRSILIKASYDGLLKKQTGYKGMYLNEEAHECWTLKFEQYSGIFGLILISNKKKIGEFKVFYFPAPDEEIVDKLSIGEAYITQSKDYIDKIREFSKHEDLLARFSIATIYLHVNSRDRSFFLFYESNFRDKIYAKDGLTHPFQENTVLIEKNGIDKNFPSFRYLFVFMNFLNTTISFIMKSSPQIFEVYKAKGNFLTYDKKYVFCEKKTKSLIKIFVLLAYGKDNFNDTLRQIVNMQQIKKIPKSSIFHTLFKDGLNAKKNIFSKKSDNLKPTLVVVTGFLGSGKTNFLQNYIEYETEKNRFVGIVQNEIGKTGLDGRLVDYDYSLVEMDEGCVCCSLSGQLRSAISILMKKSIPNTILLETTGVANPFNLLSELHELEDMIDLEAIVTIVDAKNAMELFEKYEIFKDQIKAADVILLNKSDLVKKSELEKIGKLLKNNNKCANIIKTVRANIHPNLIKANLTQTTSQIATLISEEEEHKRDHVNEKISSIKIDIAKPLNMENFSKYLKSIPKNIFRIKGIVNFQNHQNSFVVQFVNGSFEFVEQENPNKTQTFLIYIGQDINKNSIINKFQIFL